MKRLVILGGGYGGLRIIERILSPELPDDVFVTLVDRMPFHGLKTEYYALAAGTEPEMSVRVAFPNDPRLTIKYGEVSGVDLDERLVHFAGGDSLSYDWLVLALGCEDRYHDIPGAQEFTNSIQTMSATRNTYAAINNLNPYQTVTIVGGGLSGVELASELRESRPDLNIRIVDRGESILSPFPKKLQEYASQWFVEHDVQLVSMANVNRVEPGVLYNHDEPVESDVIVWTAGIQANRIVRALPIETDNIGRAKLNAYHQLPSHPNVYVVGDCASLPLAPSAQTAELQGDQIAMILKKDFRGDEYPASLPAIKHKGFLGSLGKKEGFGVMGKMSLVGQMPRVMKSGVLWMYKKHLG
ncbi:NAD(P)/FAD-dependent oxidoreductase [Brevibacillus composti]|uniref:NAD(P)/FAD-dependent oxidoreductase n=1 Tax=Brevibacillus composti TaxID=2796470 RepID=A0A7T5EME1_9BACL|nr:NAD(P)/FAD-dependent oxidoreductase [Brevibacillus composti]QQE75296.1 NAD(P)/FAD-dependent oxidoreductase [Brevibacillus composti]QUO42323.1 NAD(P)/FAD-dependent oxidoreductase [Brevibacillus composti]